MNTFDFETWFDLFVDETRRLKYVGPIDKDSFIDDFENEKPPEEAGVATPAQEFVKEMEP